MDHRSTFSSIAQGLEILKNDGLAFFEAVNAIDGMKMPAWEMFDRRNRDYYWDKLSPELQDKAKDLSSKIVSLAGLAIDYASKSPLISDADKKDISTIAKAIRAGFHLREYSTWDDEILHDEGQVLGVTRAGQSDNDPLSPVEALRRFSNEYERLSAIVDLMSVSNTYTFFEQRQGDTISRIRPNTAFIMMWINPSEPGLQDTADAIKDIFNSFGIRATRADDIEHEGVITERIINEIKTSEFLMADLTGARPSVYYEVGYAHALNRRVILYRKSGTTLHFDLAGYNCPEYTNLHELKEKLARRLQEATNKTPSSTTGR